MVTAIFLILYFGLLVFFSFLGGGGWGDGRFFIIFKIIFFFFFAKQHFLFMTFDYHAFNTMLIIFLKIIFLKEINRVKYCLCWPKLV